jgi:hypothetical protein
MRRHPQLRLRKPQPTSAATANGFTPEDVLKLFDIYEPLLEKIQFSPHRLYNSDETGLSVVQHKVCRVVSPKGKRQIAALASAERGSLVTVVTCMSAERRGSSRCGAAVLLTSSPYKNKLTEDLENNEAKDKKKEGNDKTKGGVKQNQTRD